MNKMADAGNGRARNAIDGVTKEGIPWCSTAAAAR